MLLSDPTFGVSVPPKKINTFSESDVLHLVSAFKNATKNPNYRAALQVKRSRVGQDITSSRHDIHV